MKSLFWISINMLWLVLLAPGCVQKSRIAIDATAPRGDQIITGYDVDGSPIYGFDSRGDLFGQGRMVAWKADLTIETSDITNAVERAVSLVEKGGGYVQCRTDNAGYGVTLKLRIPAHSLTNVVGSMDALGAVTSRHVENADVTEQYVDAEARLKSKVVLRDRLRSLLDKATEVKDILAIETELSRVQGDIDSTEARIKSLKGKIDFATLDLSFILKQEKPKKILGPLGLIFKGIFWTVEKLFVIRDVEPEPPRPVAPNRSEYKIDDWEPEEVDLSGLEHTVGEYETGKGTPKVDDSAALTYTVQEGDTLVGISRLFVVSVEDIRRVNPMVRDRDVSPGQTILIPPSSL